MRIGERIVARFVWAPREFQAATVREDGDKALHWLRTVYRKMRAEGKAS